MDKDKTQEQALQCAIENIEVVARSLVQHIEKTKRPTTGQMYAMKNSLNIALEYIKIANK